tara:strand:- start:3901 stop:4458 length:558 start_codon:yes stop_codon:yes gene_type:complete
MISKNFNFRIFNILFILFFLNACQENMDLNKKLESIYDYHSDQILGDPIRISISEGNVDIYKIVSDTLLDSLGNILLYGGVGIEVFDDKGYKTNDIFSNKAIVYTNSDSMSAYGDVMAVSSLNGYKLYTEKIILYNDTKLVKSNSEILFVQNEDSLRGIGFWSDFDMVNWKIDKPIGSIQKGSHE